WDSIVEIFGSVCYQTRARQERIVPAAQPRADCARGASALSWTGRNIPGVDPRRKSIRDDPAPACAGATSEEKRHGRKTVRPPRGGHLVRPQAPALGPGHAARALPRPALCELGVRGRARLWRRNLQVHRALAAAEAIG